jgi:hypothetical protein
MSTDGSSWCQAIVPPLDHIKQSEIADRLVRMISSVPVSPSHFNHLSMHFNSNNIGANSDQILCLAADQDDPQARRRHIDRRTADMCGICQQNQSLKMTRLIQLSKTTTPRSRMGTRFPFDVRGWARRS